jgi:hypothetical protein
MLIKTDTMSSIDKIYVLIMFILPYLICFALYAWVGQKAWKAPKNVARIISLLFVMAGAGFTIYRLVQAIPTVFTNENFEFSVLIITVIVLAFAAIALAFAEPDPGKT